jgi:hypothetical protein
MVKRFEIGQSAAKHLTKGDEGSTTSQSNLRCLHYGEMTTNGFLVFYKTRRYSLDLQETVRSKDKEPYDNIIGRRS